MKAAIIIALCSVFWLSAAQQDKMNQNTGTSADVSLVSVVVENKIREAWQDFKEKKEGARKDLFGSETEK